MNLKQYFLSSWQGASQREQRTLLALPVVATIAIIWWLALAPALSVWRNGPAQHLLLQSQLQHMQALQAQARVLQSKPKPNAAQSRKVLEESLSIFGTAAQVSAQADRLNVTIKGVGADAFAQWLASSRQNAHLVPTEVRMARDGALWTGSVSFLIPAP